MAEQQTTNPSRTVTGPWIATTVSLVAAAVLPFFFWREALRGYLFHATRWGLACYLLILASALLAWCAASVALLFRGAAKLWCSLALALVGAALLCLGLKWIGYPFRRDWFELFHNRMGLGMEILGPIPNMIIDGLLFAVLLVTLIALNQSVRRTTPSVPSAT